MSDTKQVNVDNWGIHFLQRLKHFFNRTDYCDLTLQFQDNAQLKVHRLVLNACTEYFELLERTCEMYEDCLVMPDDLQADVVVPIVNFMYTGHLEFKQDLLEKLYQTSLVMNMPVLSKLLESHRQRDVSHRPAPIHSYSKNIRPYTSKQIKLPVASSSGVTQKRTFSKSFEQDTSTQKSKKPHLTLTHKADSLIKNGHQSSDTYNFPVISERNKHISLEPRPTRYELPEELDEDNIFDNSFTSISYTSKPLMIHPETVKQYGSKKPSLFEDASSSKRFFRGPSNDIVECRKISINSNLFDDGPEIVSDENELFHQPTTTKESKDASQLFDQIIDNETPKLTIETKDAKQANIDHAKIISEVLKKYPHLVKSNKNIKLKILNTPSKTKKKVMTNMSCEEKDIKPKQEPPDFTYETDVIDSKEAARLIALGAENVKGPWICLICGTPGRALHFTSYYKFRRHLVEIHNEKPVVSICEYCGLKSLKRNYLLHHLYTKHGVEPPPQYHFPKCNYCNYIALTEAFLVKHKMTHTEHKGFRCNVCATTFGTSNQLLAHIQKTGHKYSAERKANVQCIYCLKVFLREANLYTHLKTHHKQSAKSDGIIDDSEEEKFEDEEVQMQTNKNKQECKNDSMNIIQYEVPISFENSYEDIQYQIEQREDGNIQLIPKKSKAATPIAKHKILNAGFENQTKIEQSPSKISPKKKLFPKNASERNDFLQEIDTSSPNNSEEILLIDNNEYVIQNYQLIPKKERSSEDYILPNTMTTAIEESLPMLPTGTQLEFENMQNTQPETSRMIVKKHANLNQPIQIVVSNEEEYKALIASNHSIIFDDGDPNKTLAMLTTQSNTSMETNTIDLDNTQSNEMMIIPENYPISVSETVAADNSNIVVVYSHPIDDQNKQYQLITNQGIEAQFVQSSTMITQNFETVTTCAPVMSAHVINAPIEETWQSTVDENTTKLPISVSSETQTMTSIVQNEDITDSNLNTLPHAHMLSTLKETPITMSHQSVVGSSQSDQGITYQPEEPNACTIITEHVSSDTVSQSEAQSNIVTSLNLLQHNITTPEIQPQPNVIVENTSEIMDLPDLNASVTSLCHSEANEVTDASNIDTETNEVDSSQGFTQEEIHANISIIQNEQVIGGSVVSNENQNEIVTLNLNQDEHITITNEDQSQQIIMTNESQNGQIVVVSENQDVQTIMVNENQEESTVTSKENQVDQIDMSNEDQEEQIIVMSAENQDDHIIESQDSSTLCSETENSVTIETHHIEINHDGKSDDKVPEDSDVAEMLENNEKDTTKNIHSANENVQIISQLSSDKTLDINQSDLALKVNPKENIQNLTSEWSDEEEADSQQEQVSGTNTNSQAEELSEMEESLENIQQEVDKHMRPDLQNQEEKLSSEQKNTTSVAASNEKISSLLNDWDDNDSQEEDINNEAVSEQKNISENENSTEATSEQCSVDSEQNVSKEIEVTKDDNIRSLVSDWDEEEEQEIKD